MSKLRCVDLLRLLTEGRTVSASALRDPYCADTTTASTAAIGITPRRGPATGGAYAPTLEARQGSKRADIGISQM